MPIVCGEFDCTWIGYVMHVMLYTSWNYLTGMKCTKLAPNQESYITNEWIRTSFAWTCSGCIIRMNALLHDFVGCYIMPYLNGLLDLCSVN